MQQFEFPRKEVGVWVKSAEASPSYQKVEGHHVPKTASYNDRVVKCVDSQLQLFIEEKLVSTLAIEIPSSPGTSQAVAFTGNGERIWYFGLEQGRPCLFLLNGFDLQVVTSFDPMNQGIIFDEIHDCGWGELSLIIDSFYPDRVLAYSNLGDSPFVCAVFSFNESTITEVTQPKFIQTIVNSIDERIHSVRLLSSTSMLVVDDLTQLLLFDLPSKTQVKSTHVCYLLEVEEDCPAIWKIDEEDPIIELGEEIGVLDNQLILNLLEIDYGREPTEQISGQAVLDIDTLEPIGLIRPPAQGMEEVAQVSKNIFQNDAGFWQLVEPS